MIISVEYFSALFMKKPVADRFTSDPIVCKTNQLLQIAIILFSVEISSFIRLDRNCFPES